MVDNLLLELCHIDGQFWDGLHLEIRLDRRQPNRRRKLGNGSSGTIS